MRFVEDEDEGGPGVNGTSTRNEDDEEEEEEEEEPEPVSATLVHCNSLRILYYRHKRLMTFKSSSLSEK